MWIRGCENSCDEPAQGMGTFLADGDGIGIVASAMPEGDRPRRCGEKRACSQQGISLAARAIHTALGQQSLMTAFSRQEPARETSALPCKLLTRLRSALQNAFLHVRSSGILAASIRQQVTRAIDSFTSALFSRCRLDDVTCQLPRDVVNKSVLLRV